MLLSNLNLTFKKKSFTTAYQIMFCFYFTIKTQLATKVFLGKMSKNNEFHVNLENISNHQIKLFAVLGTSALTEESQE